MTDQDLDRLKELTAMREEHVKSCEENHDYSHRVIADQYKDPTHFIYELIQNADDAEATKIFFDIKDEEICVSHDGRDFDIRDINSITANGKSTKENQVEPIGKFGIGFKSVFNITTCPKIHSGKFHFKIEDLIIPRQIESMKSEETLFILPLDKEIPASKIIEQTKKFVKESILFLHHIEKIKFLQADGEEVYRKEKPSCLRRAISSKESKTKYLFFEADNVKIAYRLNEAEDGQESIDIEKPAKIFAFFPTEEDANISFFVHARYQTTPNRESIPFEQEKNQRLTQNLAELFCQSLETIKQKGLLTPEFLDSLPLESGEDHHPATIIHKKLSEKIKNTPLLPSYCKGYIKSSEARLAGSQELRELFSPNHLKILYGQDKIEWLSGDITPNRTNKLYYYLKNNLAVAESEWDDVLPRLTKDFLEKQEDDWIRNLYKALNRQRYLKEEIKKLPIIRLKDGEHVQVKDKVFLPPQDADTEYKTVRKAVCNTEESLEFLGSLGLHEPDKVDDVIDNILDKKYQSEKEHISESDYKKDILEILKAHKTDSGSQKDRLENKLKETYFIKAINADGDAKKMAKPDDVYMHTANLTNLFSGIKDVFFVDNSQSCLKGEQISDLLSACGVERYLRPVEVRDISPERKGEIREEVRYEYKWHTERFLDYSIPGIEELLNRLPDLNVDIQCQKAEQLWKALSDYVNNRSQSKLAGEYKYFYYKYYNESFIPDFIRRLKKSDWIPDENGKLRNPEFFCFSKLGWEPKNDDLAKRLGMQGETVPMDEHKKVLEENTNLKEEVRILKAGKSEAEKRDYIESAGSPVWKPEYPPDESIAEIYELKDRIDKYSPERATRTSKSSSMSSTEHEEKDDKEGPSPEVSKKIGEWGEEAVYNELCKEHGEENITWHNKKGETGNSYDLSIKEGDKEIFVEVKSTEQDSPHTFEISRNQFQEAETRHYIIYAVFLTGKEKCKLVKIEDPLKKLEPKNYTLRVEAQDLPAFL